MSDPSFPIVTPAQMKVLERRCVEDYGIPSLILMENAGRSVFEVTCEMLKDSGSESHVSIFVGSGNNGGDGLVAGRHLLNFNLEVDFFVFAEEESIKGDALTNLQILKKMKAPIHFVKDVESVKEKVADSHLIMDALFGTGLSRIIEEPYFSVIQFMNHSNKPILSVDIPSGLHGEFGEVMGCAVKATRTATLGLPKKGLFENEGPKHVGDVILGEISMPRELFTGFE